MKSRFFVIRAVIASCAIGLWLVLSGGALPSTKLYFSASTDDKIAIYVSNLEGGSLKGIKRLTAPDGFDHYPVWSPSADKLAFTSERSKNVDIYVMSSNGTVVQRLTDDKGEDTQPSWAPDGTKIAFVSDREGKGKQIYIKELDSSRIIRLTWREYGSDFSPAWSPLGDKIVFVSERTGNKDIFLMNSKGWGLQRLTKTTSSNHSPVWSPDGQKIAFVSDRDGVPRIWIMNADGSDQHPLSNTTNWCESPVWLSDAVVAFTQASLLGWRLYYSAIDGTDYRQIACALDANPQFNVYSLAPALTGKPSAKKTKVPRRLVYVSDENGNNDIFTIDISQRYKHQLTDSEEDELHPTWSPDGSKIAYLSSDGFVNQIYIMNSDGSGKMKICDMQFPTTSLSWSGDGRWLYLDTCGQSFSKYINIETGETKTISFFRGLRPRCTRYGDLVFMTAMTYEQALKYTVLYNDEWRSVIETLNESTSNLEPNPDGTLFAYDDGEEGMRDIYVTRWYGKETHTLTDHPGNDVQPNWSPDGEQIAFISSRDGNPEIYIMSKTGKSQTRLTKTDAYESEPQFAPED